MNAPTTKDGRRLPIAMTMGEPAGIGPELTLRAWARRAETGAPFFAIADPAAPGGVRRQPWHFASRTQCMTCHNVWSDYALAFNAPQLDRDAQF